MKYVKSGSVLCTVKDRQIKEQKTQLDPTILLLLLFCATSSSVRESVCAYESAGVQERRVSVCAHVSAGA